MTDPKKMRIAWLAPSLSRGWRWQAIWKELSKIHPNTMIFTGRWPGFSEGFAGSFKIKVIPGFRRLRVRSGDAARGRGLMWASPRIIIELLKFRPDVIVTNGFHVWTLFALGVKAILGSRLVLLWQGVSPETGGQQGSVRLKFRRWAGKFFDLSMTNTFRGAGYLEKAVGLPPEEIRRFVGEVASRNFFMKRPLPLSLVGQKKPRFLFAGRLIAGKGVVQFLRASFMVAREKESQFSVTIVGTGPQEEELRTIVRSLGVERFVQFEGYVPYESIGSYYEASDVFVLPSFEDTWGVAAVEAMAFGKPLLCSRRAGVSELVTPGENGYLFDPASPEELASLMAQFIRHPEMIARMSKNSEKLMTGHNPSSSAAGLSRLLSGTLISAKPAAMVGTGTQKALLSPANGAISNVPYSLDPNSRTSRR